MSLALVIIMEIFQSTRPVRGETLCLRELAVIQLVISIHSPRAGRDSDVDAYGGMGDQISIHSPRAGRDRREAMSVFLIREISIHSPRAGRDMTIS